MKDGCGNGFIYILKDSKIHMKKVYYLVDYIKFFWSHYIIN